MKDDTTMIHNNAETQNDRSADVQRLHRTVSRSKIHTSSPWRAWHVKSCLMSK